MTTHQICDGCEQSIFTPCHDDVFNKVRQLLQEWRVPSEYDLSYLDEQDVDVSRDLDLYVKELRRLDDVVGKLQDERDKLRSIRVCMRSLRAPIGKLLDEILAEILGYVFDPSELESSFLKGVCSKWRRLIHNAPQLCSKISVYLGEPDASPHRVGPLLQASRDHPLWIDLSWADPELSDDEDSSGDDSSDSGTSSSGRNSREKWIPQWQFLLQKSVHRITTLMLSPSCEQSRTSFDRTKLSRTESVDFPALQNLHLIHPTDEDMKFFRSCPELRTLTLDRPDTVTALPLAFHSVHCLRLRRWPAGDIPGFLCSYTPTAPDHEIQIVDTKAPNHYRAVCGTNGTKSLKILRTPPELDGIPMHADLQLRWRLWQIVSVGLEFPELEDLILIDIPCFQSNLFSGGVLTFLRSSSKLRTLDISVGSAGAYFLCTDDKEAPDMRYILASTPALTTLALHDDDICCHVAIVTSEGPERMNKPLTVMLLWRWCALGEANPLALHIWNDCNSLWLVISARVWNDQGKWFVG